MKKILILAMIIGAVTTHPTTALAKTIDGVAAVVEESVITVYDLRQRLKELRISKAKYSEVLDRIIDDELIQIEVRRRGLSATDDEVQQAINTVMQQSGISSQAQLLEAIRLEGSTYTAFRKNQAKQIENLRFAAQVLRANIEVEAKDIEAYYRQQYLKRGSEPLYTLRHIFLEAPNFDKKKRKKAEQLAKTIKKQLKAGGKFEELAKAHGDDPTAPKGGLLGDFVKSELQASFFNAIAHLEAGQISDVVSTAQGLYLFKVDAIGKAPPPPLNRVRDEIANKVRSEEMDRFFRIWLRQARKKAYIDIRIKDNSAL